jgi:hypothetical protein
MAAAAGACAARIAGDLTLVAAPGCAPNGDVNKIQRKR